jgi:hypothetical protein
VKCIVCGAPFHIARLKPADPTPHCKGCKLHAEHHQAKCNERSLMSQATSAFTAGAAVAFGLMGMAEAIQRTYLCPYCREHTGPDEDERWGHLVTCDEN